MGWGERQEIAVQRGSVPVLTQNELDTIDRLAKSVRSFLARPTANNRESMETALSQFDEVCKSSGATKSVPPPTCKQCDSGLPVVAEVEGRVLVCIRCRDDDTLRRHAWENYR